MDTKRRRSRYDRRRQEVDRRRLGPESVTTTGRRFILTATSDVRSKIGGVTMTEPSSTPASPPADAIRTSDAIELLAGKKLKTNSTAYIRHQGRLVRGAKQGRLSEYRLLGPDGVLRHSCWYSRAEVLALRDSLAGDGFTPAATSSGRAVRAIIKRAERDGLVSLADGAKLGWRDGRGGAQVD